MLLTQSQNASSRSYLTNRSNKRFFKQLSFTRMYIFFLTVFNPCSPTNILAFLTVELFAMNNKVFFLRLVLSTKIEEKVLLCQLYQNFDILIVLHQRSVIRILDPLSFLFCIYITQGPVWRFLGFKIQFMFGA